MATKKKAPTKKVTAAERDEGLASLAEREAVTVGGTPSLQSADAWVLVRERLAALELSDETLDTAIKAARPTVGLKAAVFAAFDLCGFYAEAVLSGEDKKRELDVCCTIAADLYARYPDG